MVKIPKIKKSVKAFLVGEEGKISKKALMKTGALLTIAAGSAIQIEASHGHHNSLELGYTSFYSYGAHSDHVNHSSHGSHGSCGTASW